MYKVYLSLGSNLGNREENLEKAMELIEKRAGKIVSMSAFYYSLPWGFESEHGFVNNCISIETKIEPLNLLNITQDIEKELGRKSKSTEGYADRIIDIDLLFINDLDIDCMELKIPHPLIAKRDFVLIPLKEIAAKEHDPLIAKKILKILS